MLRAAGITDKGRTRPTNQDWFAVDDGLRLLAVADGMGGHQAGEVAAHVAIDALVDLLQNPPSGWTHGYDPGISPAANLLRTAVHFANDVVRQTAGTCDDYAGMGTTIVAALIVGDRLEVAHVGDSRLYLLSHGRLRQITRDDTWMAAVMTDNPRANVAQFNHHPLRHALTNVVGTQATTVVHVEERILADGDLLLLTTDGVHGVVDVSRMEDVLLAGYPPEQAASTIVKTALSRGSRDNCTAIVARYTKS